MFLKQTNAYKTLRALNEHLYLSLNDNFNAYFRPVRHKFEEAKLREMRASDNHSKSNVLDDAAGGIFLRGRKVPQGSLMSTVGSSGTFSQPRRGAKPNKQERKGDASNINTGNSGNTGNAVSAGTASITVED